MADNDSEAREAHVVYMTNDERTVIYHLVDTWNAFLKLPVVHADDATEFRQLIHAAQDKIFSRSGRRVF